VKNKKPKKTKPPVAKYMRETYSHKEEEPLGVPSAKDALKNIRGIQRAMSVCFLLSKLHDAEEGTVIMPEKVFHALSQLVDALVDYTMAHVELENESDEPLNKADTCRVCGCDLEDNDDLEDDEYEADDLCCDCGEEEDEG
jgi:hypothetical protein